MENNTISILENMLVGLLNAKFQEAPPTEEEFNEEVSQFKVLTASIYPVSAEDFDIIVKRVRSYLVVQMDVGVCIKDPNSEHRSWLPASRADLDFFFWERYKRYLEKVQFWNTRVTAKLDSITDEIVDLFGNPKSEYPFKRRGMILGDVQSGKTANYTALCNKAADTGYRIIIVLTGMMENLRIQTQERLDAEFSGRESQYFLDPKAEQALRNRVVGVGKFGNEKRIASFTSVTKDFDINTLKSNDLSIHSVTDPVVLVIKKNKKILENLARWLKNNNIDDATGKILLPLLVIDDEADNASVNTKDQENSPTAINAGIRIILEMFNQSTYVGITATPFANIFINPDSEDDMHGEDLFPRDFIYALTPPEHYIGADKIFGDDDSKFSSTLVPIIPTEIDAFFPFSHKKDLDIDELPQSLYKAIAYYVLLNGIRDVRGHKTTHRSMMIHVSRFTQVQNKIAELVNEWIIQLRSDLHNYAKIPNASDTIENIQFLKNIWNEFELYKKVECSWDAFLTQYLYRAIAPVNVRAVNQSTGSSSLDYYNHREHGLRVIAVGGNSLSRGLTLEGLCVSYFYRKSQMYDTLLQMGRWFGYRPGYEDLVKIWISKEATDWYGYITAASNDLKHQLSEMKSLNQTPMQFGLKVRQDPNSLIVTARNKMRAATSVKRPVSVSGKLLETPRLRLDKASLDSNEQVFKFFLCNIVQNATEQPNKTCRLWTGVQSELIISLLENFKTHPWHLSFQGKALAEYIQANLSHTTWDVALLEGEKTGLQYIIPCNASEISIYPENRKVSVRDNQILISGTKVRVGSGGSTAIGLTEKEKQEAKEQFILNNPTKTSVPDSAYLIKGRKPILMLHVVKVNFEGSQINPGIDIPPYLFALGVGFPATDSDTKIANYVVNMVELRNWMDPDEDEDE